MDYAAESLRLHQRLKGKIAVASKALVANPEQLSLAYTPGVAEPCRRIAKNPELVYDYTMKGNYVAVISDGSAVLGLGDIGPAAALPVMEGKCVLFKEFGGVDAIPLCLGTKDPDRIVEIVAALTPALGGVNLEDIAAPRCFAIEQRLKQLCPIPVFHDDQHGTAIIVLAALINALKLLGKKKEDIRVAMSGGGAAGCAIARLLLSYGVRDIALCDIDGVIYEGRPGLDDNLRELAKLTNCRQVRGGLEHILIGADVFIGVSVAGLVNGEMIASMAPRPVVFAMANPSPEIEPAAAKAAGAYIVGTGRSDYANQINNVLAFPGVFRGALDAMATDINEEMKMAAAYAIANIVSDEELLPEYVLPKPFDPRVGPVVAAAVAAAAASSGVARKQLTYDEELQHAAALMKK